MKKLTVIALLNSYTSGKSGGDIAFIEIFKRFDKVDLLVVTSRMGERLCRSLHLKAKYLLTSNEKSFSSLGAIYIFRILNGLFKSLIVNKKDILYVTSDSLPDVLPAFIYKVRFGKSIKWIQKIYHIIPNSRLISHIFQNLSFFLIKRGSSQIIVDNEHLKNNLIDFGFNPKIINVNHLGIDPNYFKKIPKSKIKFDGIFMSRLHKSKGIFELPIIWDNVLKKSPTAKLGIIGTGNSKNIKILQKMITDKGLKGSIKLLGYLNDEKAFSLLKASKVFIFPSHEEGFGIIVLEALACKIPVIAYDLPAFQETFKRSIMTVPCFDQKMFAEAISTTLQSPAKNRHSLSEFTWDRTAKREYEILNRI